MNRQIIGRGTWLDMVAYRIVQREEKLNRQVPVLVTESGFGPSGIPHIGTLSDVVRAYGVTLALQTLGKKAELIVFADDMDGLRKVPAGISSDLKQFLGRPLSRIPDPFGCDDSYGNHMSRLLRESADRLGIEYRFYSAHEAYRSGLLTEQVEKILGNAKRVGEIIYEETGQEKYLSILPYFPLCEKCGRIYTTRAIDFAKSTDLVRYVCEGGADLTEAKMEGCGHEGEVDIKTGSGKLPWKTDFAARWHALKVNYEAYGKELAASVRVADRVCEEILGYPPPYHVQWELFLEKTGKKLAKSAGNIMTPDEWAKYASPESLVFLMFKRIVGARTISVEDMPVYMNEFDSLEDVYFGRKPVSDKKELAKLKGLYEYSWLLKPPKQVRPHAPYNILVYLARVAPKGRELSYIESKLREYGYLKDGGDAELERRIRFASNWARELQSITETFVSLSASEKSAVEDLISLVSEENDENKLQNGIFAIAKKHGLDPGSFFKLVYQILLGSPKGPRLGPYIVAMGNDQVAGTLRRALAD